MEQSYCKNCKFKSGCSCKVYAGRSIFDIKVCPLTTQYYSNLDEQSDFVLEHNPQLFTRWVSKKIPIKVGDNVITLTGGFGGPSGKKLKIKDYDRNSNCWTAIDHNSIEYAIEADYWYLGVIREIIPKEMLEEALEELGLVEELVEDVNVDKYSISVYNSFREECCTFCKNPCQSTKYDIYKCKKFENYFAI